MHLNTSAHIAGDTKIEVAGLWVEGNNATTYTVCLGGDLTDVTLFFQSRAKLGELRDAISAYLAKQVAEAA